MKSPTVSIVILNFNGRENLEACLESVLALDYDRAKLEIIVVDNASTDASVEWLSQTHPNIRYIVNPANLGFSRGVNSGAAMATGEYLAFLNPDMRVDVRWLDALVATVQDKPDVACAGSIVLDWLGNQVDYAGRPDDALNLAPSDSKPASAFLNSAEDVPMLFASGGAALIKRDVFHSIGGFDEDYFLYHEDVDLGWRLWLAGYRVLRSSRSRVYHKGGASSKQLSLERIMRWAQKHALYTILKNMEDDGLWNILPGLIWFWIEGAQTAAFAQAALGDAIQDLIQDMDTIWRKRLAIQRTRVRADAEIFAACGHPFGVALRHPLWFEFKQHLETTSQDLFSSPVDANALSGRLLTLCLYAYKFSHERLLLQVKSNEALSAQLTERLREREALAAQVVADRDQSIRSLTKEIGTRDRLVLSLSAELEEKDRIVAAAQTEIAEQGRVVESLGGLIARQEEMIQTLTKQAAEKKRMVAAEQRQLAEEEQTIQTLKAQIEFITSGKGWELLQSVRRVRLWLAPRGTLRDRAFRLWLREGTVRLLQSAPRLIQRASVSIQPVTLTAPVEIATAVKTDVICFSIIDWHFRFQRPQQILSRFAQDGHRVFYLSIAFARRDLATAELRPIGERIHEVILPGDPDLTIYTGDLTDPTLETMVVALREFVRQQTIDEAICLVQHPFWTPLARRLKSLYGWKVVYDCMDDHSGFALTHKRMEAIERDLGKTSDLVITTSRILDHRWKRSHPNCLLVPNAADYTHFCQLPPRDTGPLGHLPRPVIGYYGAIAEWFDVDAIYQAVTRHPEWSFVFIGHTFGAKLGRLRGLSNVHFLGEKPYAELPAFLAGFDVATIPFLRTPLTEATNPVKVFEYLSAGKPVVAAMLPELEPLGNVIYRYATADEFVQRLEKAAAEKPAEFVARRQAVARENTWQARYHSLKPRIDVLYGKASIIIVTWQNLDLTRQCLDSVLADLTYPNYKVIVVDNGSSDGTVEYLKALGEKDPRVKIVLNEQNIGFARANNMGLRHARDSEFIVLLNNDTVVPRGWLARLLRHASKPDIGMVGPVTNWAGNEARIEVGYTSLKDMETFARAYIAAHEDVLFDIKVLAMFCVALRKSVADQIGPLDERFGAGMFEDDDYSRRVRNGGYRVVCAEDVFVHHQGRAAFSKLSEDAYRSLFETNKRLYEEKWGELWVPHVYRQR